MGGARAPDDLEDLDDLDDLDEGSRTQAWLAVSDDEQVFRSGAMYYDGQPVLEPGPGARALHPAVGDTAFQDALLNALAGPTGVALPTADETHEDERPTRRVTTPAGSAGLAPEPGHASLTGSRRDT